VHGAFVPRFAGGAVRARGSVGSVGGGRPEVGCLKIQNLDLQSSAARWNAAERISTRPTRPAEESLTPAGRGRVNRHRILDNMAIQPYTSSVPARSRDLFKQQARILKALANESRLMIVDRLSRGDCSAGELTELVGSDQSTVSKHLAVLRSHGIVEDRRDGNVVYYRLLTPCVTNFFSCSLQVLRERS